MANKTTAPTCCTSNEKTWSPMAFYGPSKVRDALRFDKLLHKTLKDEPQYVVWKRNLPSKYTSLLGPSQTWRVFRKQCDALEFARLRRSELMTFVYQESVGNRIFLVAHPIVFWYHDMKKAPEDRCSYEIIPEGAVCKLYFDLEFEKEYNPGKNGARMINTFIYIIQHFLKSVFNLLTDRSNIMDLDSTTDIKFSHHLIYQLPNAAFRDNYQIGNFVQSICSLIRNWVKQTYNSNYPPDFDNAYIKNTVKIADLHELVVIDRKGKTGLFCDESVYTKNRHFRLLGSTKRNKNAHLVLSLENDYKCSRRETLDTFLDSLLTHFPPNCLDFKLLLCGTNASPVQRSQLKPLHQSEDNIEDDRSYLVNSPHPQIDKFISNLVMPGRIYRCYYFSSSNHLVYDIVAYRYCGNIQRQHRSNNIKYVVNIGRATYFQKCFDKDCADYRSNELKLPHEIALLYSNIESGLGTAENNAMESDFQDFDVADEELDQIVNAAEKSVLSSNAHTSITPFKAIGKPSSSTTRFCSEITDQEMVEAMKQFEQLENPSQGDCFFNLKNVDCVSVKCTASTGAFEKCDGLTKQELSQVNDLLEHSDEFFECDPNFLDPVNKNVEHLAADDFFVGDLNEDDLNRALCEVERVNENVIKNDGTILAMPAAEFLNSKIFPEFGLSDSELLNIVYPNI